MAAVIGDPVTHSLSPRLHNAAFRAVGLDWVYVALPVARGQARAAVDGARALGLRGLSVTMPHKEAVAALCDGRTDQARVLAAVNTVKVEDGRWLGHNTDSGGLLAVLAQVWPGEDRPERVVVLGAGGSGRHAGRGALR